jgi:hypothetical protein
LKTAKAFLQLFEAERPKLSCVMFMIDGTLKDNLVAFASSIPDEDVYKPETTGKPGGWGRETEPHVTALFGLETTDPKDVEPIVRGVKDVVVTLGKTSLFENDDYHVLKFDVESPDMVELNKRLTKLPYKTEFPEYHPHLTIAYLKPDKKISSKYSDNATFKGRNTNGTHFIFSNPDGKHTRI